MSISRENKHLYWAWKAMKQRTQNPNCRAYRNYGARGITVCDEWQQYEPFYEWAISAGWAKGLDLDRIENDGPYSPDNCRWTSRKKNINNRRCTILLTVDGQTRPCSEWAEISGIPHGSLKIWAETKGKEYAESRISEALVSGYTSNDYGNTHRRSIIHVETGTVYRSVRDAAKAVGLAPPTISNAMREKRATSKGRFVWEELDADA